MFPDEEVSNKRNAGGASRGGTKRINPTGLYYSLHGWEKNTTLSEGAGEVSERGAEKHPNTGQHD